MRREQETSAVLRFVRSVLFLLLLFLRSFLLCSFVCSFTFICIRSCISLNASFSIHSGCILYMRARIFACAHLRNYGNCLWKVKFFLTAQTVFNFCSIANSKYPICKYENPTRYDASFIDTEPKKKNKQTKQIQIQKQIQKLKQIQIYGHRNRQTAENKHLIRTIDICALCDCGC